MFRKLSITILALGLSVFLGNWVGSNIFTDSQMDEHATARVMTKSLEEEMYFVDLIVKGTIIEQKEPFSRNAGLPEKTNFNYDVTPSIVKVKEVIYGELDEDIITFLQHGTQKENKETRYLLPDEEVILLLVKTDDNYYWSYQFEDGIWRVENGTVVSQQNNVNSFLNADSTIKQQQNYDVETFIDNIRQAALNKKRPADF
ncbi:hypothetical protein [Paenibacillus sp. Y412MC10]|uniref:hypothetical protein n=1 Tax=Geobacillus sp. (strain Y412MC10) TaxID=481743 RepID=UPI00017894FF|nr:hypothetical protein [Paenibacillus sp. Y412MC10]ACX63374.1 hypothetical protein GYMC10_1082 [Paenibacillus sp. Y412MC10]